MTGGFELVSEGQQLKIPYDGKCDIHCHIEFFNEGGSSDIYHSMRKTSDNLNLGVNRFRLPESERRGSDLSRMHVDIKKGETIEVIINPKAFDAIYSFGAETYFEVTCYPDSIFRFN